MAKYSNLETVKEGVELVVGALGDASKGEELDTDLAQQMAVLSLEGEELTIWDQGFVRPNDITPPELADRMKELDEKKCMIVSAEDLDNIWIEVEEDLPDRLAFIEQMTKFYISDESRWLDLIVRKADVEDDDGGYVVVVVNGQCSRARVDGWVYRKPDCDWHPERNPVVLYEVYMIDLGEKQKVDRMSMLYMHEKFAKEPTWIMHVRLAKLDAFYEEFVQGGGILVRRNWNKRVFEKFQMLLRYQSFLVKFIKKYKTEEGRPWWNATFLRFAIQDPEGPTIDQQIIRMAFPPENKTEELK